MAAAGVDYCEPVKTSNTCLCFATIKKLMKDWPEGSYLVMKSNNRIYGERPLMEIGYK